MLVKKIDADYIQAMKSKDSFRASTLSFLRAQIKNVMIDKKQDTLKDEDTMTVIRKQIKQRQDAIEQYNKGGREDLAQKEQKELDILTSYLPAALSAEELKPLVEESIKEAEAQGIKDMGRVMKIVMPKVAGRADNKTISDLVREALA